MPPQDPRNMGQMMAQNIPGVQGGLGVLQSLQQNAVDPLMALIQQLFGGGGVMPGAAMPISGPLPRATGQFDPVSGEQIIRQPPPTLKGRMTR